MKLKKKNLYCIFYYGIGNVEIMIGNFEIGKGNFLNLMDFATKIQLLLRV